MFDPSKVEFDKSNGEPRCACVLLLDTSSSMTGKPIDALNEGLRIFEKELKNDELASKRVEIAVVSFNSSVTIASDFTEAGNFTAPLLSADGLTAMGAGINKALDMLEARKTLYKQNGVTFYRPWLFMITDGYPTDVIESAISRSQSMETQKKVSFYAVGVEEADMRLLAQLTPRTPLKLKGLAFRDMFLWLSGSMSAVSASNPTDETMLQSPLGWGTTASV